MQIFIAIVTNLYISCGRSDIFMMLSFLIQNEDVFLFAQNYLYDFQEFLERLSHASFCTLLSLFSILSFLVFLIVDEDVFSFIIFLFHYISYCRWRCLSLSLLLVFVWTNTIDFCVLILYPSIWLNFLTTCISFSIKPPELSDTKSYHFQWDILQTFPFQF